MKITPSRPRLSVTTGGKGVVSHAGARLLVDLADELGLTEHLSLSMAPTKTRRRGHDRGEVLVNLAVALADGATAISDVRVLADQPGLFGQVASVPTTWRTLEAIDDATLERVAGARSEARRAAWAMGMDPGFYVIDIDGTLVDAHSEKEQATPTYKRGFGFYPLMAYLDATGEALAGMLRQGNAGSGTAEDHIVVLDAALRQLPVDPRADEVIVRTDAGGTSHALAEACRERGVRFVGGCQLRTEVATTIMAIPKNRWMRGISADGAEERDTGEVAEITDLVDMRRWPDGTRMLIRRERAPSRGPAHVHRRRGLSLPGLRDRSRRARHLFHRSALSGPGTLRVPHPRHQGHRARQPPLGQLRHQCRLARHRAHRLGPPGLDERALSRGRAATSCTQALALHPVAHRRRPRPFGPVHHLAHRRDLALGRRPRRRLRPAARLGGRHLIFESSDSARSTERPPLTPRSQPRLAPNQRGDEKELIQPALTARREGHHASQPSSHG